MTITIDLSPAEEARLRTQARQRGQTPETIAQSLVRAGLETPSAAELWNTPVPEEAHAALVRLLQQDGLMTRVPTRSLGPPPPPIQVQGPPVSQTLLEERR